MADPLRGKTAIVGAAESDLGKVSDGLTSMDLMAQASLRALSEAGLTKNDVDGVFSSSAYYQMASCELAEYMGIRPRYTDSTTIGGSSFVSHLHHAARAINAGAIDVALIAYGSTQRSDSGRLVSSATLLPYEDVHKARHPVSMYALAASRHMHEYGTTREQLAEVAVAARGWAKDNPKAFMRDDLTIEDVVNARLISEPFTSRDCCVVTDGGGALVVTSAERAKDLAKPPVHVLGIAEAHWHRHISQMPDLTTTAAVESAPRAYEMAGVKPADFDVVMIYDAFTISTIMFLEDLGLCAKGEGGAFVADGGIAPGGRLAVNTNGGGLSYCHPGMYSIFTMIEAVHQLRGESGARQVADAKLAVAHGSGGVLSTQVTAVLGCAETV
jgi:acetyl-CoA acetyltransferase